jgi:5-methylcytosine-specific restriction endonuclease McrA
VWRSNYCSDDCRQLKKKSDLKLREKNCMECGSVFIPRPYQLKTGDGKYCSKKCRNTVMVRAAHTPEANKKRVESFLKVWNPPKGENHPNWRGGYDAYAKRYKESGKKYELVKNYRQKNPEKVREWSINRRSKYTERLPRGTVKKIGESQKWLCVCCRIDISKKYHIDHITALSKGGKNVSENIQLLCPKCNTEKSAKNPIDFMQEKGYLL